MNQCLALMSAILANPDDDLPRLVFADWLEENGTTDADAARVEFIRLGCKSKAKQKITPVETKWLDANWQRLLVNTDAARRPKTTPMGASREGRFLRLTCRWLDSSQVRVGEVVFEYVRGFARRIEYKQGHSYLRFWQAATTDEPLAYHRPELRPSLDGNRMIGWYARILPTIWGEEVFARAPGQPEPSGREKLYHPTLSTGTSTTGFFPAAVADEHGLGPAEHRQRAAVATAMTALAREFVGLADSCEKG